MKLPKISVQLIDDTPPQVQLDQHGHIIGLPDAIVDQIADRVIEKLRIQQRLDDLSLL